MLNQTLLIIVILGYIWAQNSKVEKTPPIPVETPIWVGGESKAPAPVIDTNWIYQGSTSNPTRKVAVGKYFKGPNDDTLRVVTVQSGGTRYLVIATDTSSAGFGTRKFRIETPIQFPSGASEMAIAVGDVDGDGVTDIVTGDGAAVGGKVWLRRFKWGGTNWVRVDSIGLGAQDTIWDIAIGDANNDGRNDIVFNCSYDYIMIAKWNPYTSAWDTTRIFVHPGPVVKSAGVGVGDVVPEITGNEIYFCSGFTFEMVYWSGTQWRTQVISSRLNRACDLVIGDIDPTLPGNEIAIVHSNTSYQLSVWNYVTGLGTWNARYWNILGSNWGTSGYNDITLGDFLAETPGNEVVLSNTGTALTNPSVWFNISPNGRASAGTLPKLGAYADYGVLIADVNKWRQGNELIMSAGGNLVEMEQRVFANDIALLPHPMRTLPLLKTGVNDTFNVEISNPGISPVSSVSFRIYSTKNLVPSQTIDIPVMLNPGDIALVKVPYQIGTSLGIDTVFVALPDDDNSMNNGPERFYVEIWDDSTVAATSFSDSTFPLGWNRVILSDTFNWTRVTSGFYPTVSPLDAPAMAMYGSFSASTGAGARLISPKINVGSVPRKVKLRFYMVHHAEYPGNYDSIYVEYSLDGVNFNTLEGFQSYDSTASTPTWRLHEVEIGDFPAGAELYVAIRSRSGRGRNLFIDSLWIFTTIPTSDAQILTISIPKPVIQVDVNPVTVTFKNNGPYPITSIRLYYTLGGADTIWETWTGNLPSGSTLDYTFLRPLVPSDTGVFTLHAGVKLISDTIPNNDTTSTSIHVWPYMQLPPYSENFDENWTNSTNPPYGGWKIIDGGSESPPIVNNNDWHRYVSTSPARTVARIYYAPVENQDDWLISPRLKIWGYGTYTLNYWHYYNDFSTSSPDSGQVMISFDDGATWTELTRYSNVDDSGYKSIDLTPYIMPHIRSAETFRIAFHYGARNEQFWYVDDFSVTFIPDTTPPVFNPIRWAYHPYNTGPDTLVFEVGDISPFFVQLSVVVNDTIIKDTTINFGPGVDTVTIEIPGSPQGTVYDGYIYVEDANGLRWMTQGTWWKLYAYRPDSLALTPITTPQKGVRLSWSSPRQSLRYDGGPAYYFTGLNPGDIISVRFTPQYTPARIDSVVALFYGTSNQMHLKIYNDNNGVPGNVIFDTLITVPVSPTYLRLNLSNKNIVVNGQYHIGFEWTVANQPYPVSDDTAHTNRSLYYNAAGAQWYRRGYDWIIRSAVTYLPQSKTYAGSYGTTNLLKEHNLKRVELPQVAVKEERGEGSKYIQKYRILRSTTSGGPYDSIGVSTVTIYEDFALVTGNTYYYVVRMDYVSPDTTTYGNEASITTDFVGPQFSAFAYDTGGVGNIWVSVAITDPSGIYQDTLYYFINGGSVTFAMHDSVVGSTYYYTIPGLNVGDYVILYFAALDNSPWHNLSWYPETGYFTFVVTSVTDEKPRMYAFNVKGSNVSGRAMEFAYALPEKSDVEIAIYSVTGQRVATLVKGPKDAGYYTARWNGTDDRGSKVGSGVYIVKMVTPKKSFTERIILTK